MSFSYARKKEGFSQEQAARELGVDQSSVCLWETGKTMPRASMLPKIAKLYGCTIDELLTQEETGGDKT